MRTVLILFCLNFLAVSAMAQSQRDPEKAAAAFEAAKRAKALGNYKRSIEKLREAYKYLPDPMIQVNIARRYIDLNDPENALKELRGIKTGNRRVRKLVKQEITSIEELIGKPLMVTFDTDPPGALITFDNGDPLTTPGRRHLTRRDYKVSIALDGHETINDTFSIRGVRPINRSWKLTAFHGHIRIVVGGIPPGTDAQVTLNDKPVKAGVRMKVPRGKHWIRCMVGEEHKNQLMVDVNAGGDLDVRCVLTGLADKSDSGWKSIAGWSSVGAGAAAILTGVALFASYAADTSDYPEPQYTIDSESKRLGGGIATGVGAGLVGLGTYWLLTK